MSHRPAHQPVRRTLSAAANQPVHASANAPCMPTTPSPNGTHTRLSRAEATAPIAAISPPPILPPSGQPLKSARRDHPSAQQEGGVGNQIQPHCGRAAESAHQAQPRRGDQTIDGGTTVGRRTTKLRWEPLCQAVVGGPHYQARKPATGKLLSRLLPRLRVRIRQGGGEYVVDVTAGHCHRPSQGQRQPPPQQRPQQIATGIGDRTVSARRYCSEYDTKALHGPSCMICGERQS